MATALPQKGNLQLATEKRDQVLEKK